MEDPQSSHPNWQEVVLGLQYFNLIFVSIEIVAVMEYFSQGALQENIEISRSLFAENALDYHLHVFVDCVKQ